MKNLLFLLVLIVGMVMVISSCKKEEEEEDPADCCSTGSATIKGTVEDYDSEALSGVSVTFSKSETTSSTVATIDNGTYKIYI